MKNFALKTFSLFLLLLFCQQVTANKIIVKGYIRNSDGAAEPGWFVTVSIDSTLTPACIQHHFVYSNADGFYVDTLTCDHDIQQVIISIYDCNGTLLVHKEAVTNEVIESS